MYDPRCFLFAYPSACPFSHSLSLSIFRFRHALRQHMLRHAGKKYKCGLPGCPTVLRTASELRSHRSLVHESSSSDKRYQCPDCAYAARTESQLRRWVRRSMIRPMTRRTGATPLIGAGRVPRASRRPGAIPPVTGKNRRLRLPPIPLTLILIEIPGGHGAILSH